MYRIWFETSYMSVLVFLCMFCSGGVVLGFAWFVLFVGAFQGCSTFFGVVLRVVDCLGPLCKFVSFWSQSLRRLLCTFRLEYTNTRVDSYISV